MRHVQTTGSHTYLHTSHFVEKSLEMITSGAIQGYVPAPVICVVCSISRARPKSVILIVLLYKEVGVMALARRTAKQNEMVTITHTQDQWTITFHRAIYRRQTGICLLIDHPPSSNRVSTTLERSHHYPKVDIPFTNPLLLSTSTPQTMGSHAKEDIHTYTHKRSYILTVAGLEVSVDK